MYWGNDFILSDNLKDYRLFGVYLAKRAAHLQIILSNQSLSCSFELSIDFLILNFAKRLRAAS